jgi:hypothetical protein
MKYFMANLGVNLVALTCVASAAYLVAHDKRGWGWFLLVGLLAAASVSFKDEK